MYFLVPTMSKYGEKKLIKKKKVETINLFLTTSNSAQGHWKSKIVFILLNTIAGMKSLENESPFRCDKFNCSYNVKQLSLKCLT